MNKTVTMWVAGLISFIFSLLTAITMYAFSRSANGSDKIKEEISRKADKTYVDHQDKILDEKINRETQERQKTIDRIDSNLTEIRNYIMKEK